MIRLRGVRVLFGGKSVLDGVDFDLPDRCRIAVVGRNGAGKSTLLKVAAGLLEPDEGSRSAGKNETVGYLAQEWRPDLRGDETVWSRCWSRLESVVGLADLAEAKMAEAAEISAEDPRHLQLLDEAAVLHDRFEIQEGYRAEARCGRVLSGLGFGKDRWETPISELSGGWKIRLGLAELLLERPHCLLLDEPTNHLDLESRAWLLHELRNHPGSLALISHDRHFLDRLVSRTVEVEGGRLQITAGGFSAYREARVEHQRLRQLEAASRAEERARIMAFITRFRAKASKAVQVQSRIKMLERLPPIEMPDSAKGMSLRFPEPPRCGQPMISLRALSKSYGSLDVLKDVSGSLYPGDRVQVVGPNGVGKSTLLRIIAGEEGASSGVVQRDPGLRIGWFAQEQSSVLDPEQSVLDAVAAFALHLQKTALRAFLGSLRFPGSEVDKACGVLSGGERSRVALARILIRPTNLLVLDEPTNHLDLETQEALASAIEAWGGAVIFVSHDRDFANRFANRIWSVSDGGVEDYAGCLDDFLWAKAVSLGWAGSRSPGEAAPDAWLLRGLSTGSGDSAQGAKTSSAGAAAPVSAAEDYAASKARARERRKKEKESASLEAEIGELEERLGRIDEEMVLPEKAEDWEWLNDKSKERERLNSRLTEALDRWAALGEELGA